MSKDGHRVRCADCQHWESPAEDGWSEEYKQQKGIAQYGLCSALKGADGSFVNEGALAFAFDAEAYRAGLRCLPDFGCALFEPKA